MQRSSSCRDPANIFWMNLLNAILKQKNLYYLLSLLDIYISRLQTSWVICYFYNIWNLSEILYWVIYRGKYTREYNLFISSKQRRAGFLVMCSGVGVAVSVEILFFVSYGVLRKLMEWFLHQYLAVIRLFLILVDLKWNYHVMLHGTDSFVVVTC